MEKLRAYFKMISLKNFLYPGIFFSYAIGVGVLFFFAAHALTAEVNKAFVPQGEGAGFSFNMEEYNRVALKLNIPLHTEKEEIQKTENTNGTPTTTPAPLTETEPTPALEKNLLSIAIYNGSGKTGAAAQAKQHLITEGFTVLATGNNPATLDSVIKIKERSRDYLPLLEKSLNSIKISPLHETLDEANEFDAIIIIGKDTLTQE